MRKIIVLSFVSLDGVMQAPGGPEEDTSDKFIYGGWSFPYFDAALGSVMAGQMGGDFDLLLGRRTYDLFASFWPHQDPVTNPGAGPLNKATKYVVSHSDHEFTWENTRLITGDVVAEIAKLQAADGPMLQVHGSSNLIQTLLSHDLVDELWLKTYPLVLGRGKRLFGEGTLPRTFELVESMTTPKGVITASYRRSGEIKTGSFGPPQVKD
jgi:dihydrofolate reductase